MKRFKIYTLVNDDGVLTLKFSGTFNDSLVPYHEVMKQASSLVLSNNYNRQIELLPNINSLTLGNHYNQPLVLTPYIHTLILGYCYNQPLVLTANIKKLVLGHNYNQELILSPNITTGIFDTEYDRPISGLNKKMIHFTCKRISPNPTNGLNKKLISMTFGFTGNVLHNLNKNLKYLTYQHNDLYMCKLTKNIVTVTFTCYTHCQIFLSKNLISVCFNGPYHKHVTLPKNLRSLDLFNCPNTMVSISPRLLYWSINYSMLGYLHDANDIHTPEHLIKELRIHGHYGSYGMKRVCVIDNLPANVECLKILKDTHYDLRNVPNLTKVFATE